MMADAICDRLVHNAHVLDIPGRLHAEEERLHPRESLTNQGSRATLRV
jgi:hypothetical protein